LTFRVQYGTDSYMLYFRHDGSNSSCAYTLSGVESHSGMASIEQVQANVYSILDRARSFTVYLAPRESDFEVWVDHARYLISLSDTRNLSGKGRRSLATGPLQISTQMPGKVVRILVETGARVTAGQGLIVVEAMKMQNELKAPRDGMISRIGAVEGSTVAANQTLVVIE
jgi:biotin carboxyl carrier protein